MHLRYPDVKLAQRRRQDCADKEFSFCLLHFVHIVRGLFCFRSIKFLTISESQFCFGDSLSLANVCLITKVETGLPFKCDLFTYTLIQSILDHRMILEAFKTAAPENQLDPTTA